MQNTIPQSQLSVELEEKIANLIETARRNTAIAEMLKFKRYIPAKETEKVHSELYHNQPMQWFYLPGVGRYNSFELKFNSDWNWLVSVLIEMKKYEHANIHLWHTKMGMIYRGILTIRPIDFNLQKLWQLVSDYALELQEQKQKEVNKKV